MVICRIFRRSILISRFINCTSAETNAPLLNKFTKRTHTCGELRLPDVGKRVSLYGWLAHVRKQKNNSFLVLRDAYGKVQALVPNELLTTIPDFNLESSICIEGTVVDRGRNRNKEMATGDVEIVTERIEILNPVTEIMLPLFSSSNEMNRLTYRYLDLRWERMQQALRLRAKIISQMRRFLEDKCGFVDVQTPTLASFTPGGAAEFPVPINKDGECFSLPQSPQIYKQLLMCGSMDRYYQIAICYRDETITPFRQLEFTQLDLELSFTDQESVMELIEQIVIESWPQGLEPKPSAPFPRISYSDAMNKYGMDKPDLRIPWEIFDAPFDLVEKNAKIFIARGAVPFLNEENLSQWKEWIEMLPEREDYSIIAGQNFATKFGGNSEFLQKHNISDEDAIVVCAAQNQKHILEVLGRLRNFLAEAVGLRQSQNFHFVWVHKFPLFNRNEENGALESSHHPFTAPIREHLDLLLKGKNLETIEAQHYDLVLNGVEIGGGSIRIHDATLQRHILDEILKIDSSQLQHLLTALSYGAPPHGGFALGLDRYVTILNAKGDPNASIRNVIAFPKGKLGQCFMTGSPTLLPNNFLNRYGLFRKENEKKILL